MTGQSKKWPQLLLGFGYVVTLGGALFASEGAWKNYELYLHSNSWPAVEAHVLECKTSDTWGYSGHVWGKFSHVRCNFEYTAGGVIRQNAANVGGQTFTSERLRTLPPPKLTLAKMQGWIARHPPGSVQIIHYNPSNPGAVSLGDAELDLETSSPRMELAFALGVLGAGVVLLYVGKYMRGYSDAGAEQDNEYSRSPS